jgi:glutamine cyclotransferase
LILKLCIVSFAISPCTFLKLYYLQSTLLIFIFFVTLGTRRSATSNKPVSRPKKANQGQPTLYSYAIKAEFPHDATAFTQGLEYYENCEQGGPCKQVFFESTGLRGESAVREVELLTGKVLRSKSLPKSDFGEGLTRFGDTLYQLTWQSGKAWSYKADDFEKSAKEFKVRNLHPPLKIYYYLPTKIAIIP